MLAVGKVGVDSRGLELDFCPSVRFRGVGAECPESQCCWEFSFNLYQSLYVLDLDCVIAVTCTRLELFGDVSPLTCLRIAPSNVDPPNVFVCITCRRRADAQCDRLLSEG